MSFKINQQTGNVCIKSLAKHYGISRYRVARQLRKGVSPSEISTKRLSNGGMRGVRGPINIAALARKLDLTADYVSKKLREGVAPEKITRKIPVWEIAQSLGTTRSVVSRQLRTGIAVDDIVVPVRFTKIGRQIGVGILPVQAAIRAGVNPADISAIESWIKKYQNNGRLRVDMTAAVKCQITRRRAKQIQQEGVDISDESQIKKWLSTAKDRLSVSLKTASRHRSEKERKVKELQASHMVGLTMIDACKAHGIKYGSAKNLSREMGLRWGRSRKSVELKSSPTIGKIRSIPSKLMLKNGSKVHALCGISGRKLREWIESKFTRSMTWENYGKVWHLDHIFPISRFDLSDPDQVKVACNWQNLQPLLRKANARKSDKITKPQLSLALVTA